jgi:hypothetical protein
MKKTLFFLFTTFTINTVFIAQEPIIAVAKQNVLTNCTENIIDIALSGVDSDKLEVGVKAGATIAKIAAGKYKVFPERAGDLVLDIKYDTTVFSKILIVKPTPDPKPMVNGYSGGKLSLETFQKADKVTAKILETGIKPDCQVESYQVWIRRNATTYNAFEIEVKGEAFPTTLKNYISTLKNGDSIMFINIMSKCPCDTNVRWIGNLNFGIDNTR